MNTKVKHDQFSRREFLQHGTRQAGVLGLAGVLAGTEKVGWTAETKAAHSAGSDASRFQPTDPKLVGYTEVGRFKCPRDEGRRLASGPESGLCVAAANGVCLLNSTGGVVREVALAGPARCVAATPEGVLFIGLRDHVEVYDAKGRRLTAWEPIGPRAWLTALANDRKRRHAPIHH